MDNLKKIIILLIIFVIVIIAVLFMLLNFSNNEIAEYEEDNRRIQKIESKVTKYEIYNCINQYVQYQYENNIQAVRGINNVYDENNIQYELKEANLIQLQDCYEILKNEGSTIYVSCIINKQKDYFIINIDYENNTFMILKSNENQFERAKLNKVEEKNREEIKIENNQYNEFKFYTEIKEITIINQYFNQYKKLNLKNPEMAFELLDEEYKKERFNNNYKEYENYIQNNKEKLEEINILGYSQKQNEGYIEYKLKDNYNSSYIIKEFDFMNYRILLDSYTINEEKVDESNIEDILKNNINNVFNMISNRNYEKLYSLLDETFKQNNFNTLEKFKTYVDKEFFETNLLGKITASKQGEIYIIDVSYKERASMAAEERQKKIFMKLITGTDFVMSFEVE